MPKRTLKIYCICGGALEITTNSKKALEVVETEWLKMHQGEGHKETDARTAARARRRAEQVEERARRARYGEKTL